MTSRGLQSAYSSRDVSPESRPEPYDPLRSESDPIELASLTRRLQDGHTSDGLQPGAHFGLSHGASRYEPVREGYISPDRSAHSTRESTYTSNSLYHRKALDADTQALLDRRSGELAQWHIYWATPALVVALFLAGLAAAVGHHSFYMHLDGQLATEQLKMVRYGTALAFFVKSTLVGTVIMCNRQRIWYTFRRKAMTINGIDGLFSATEDPTQFFLNWEMIRNGKLATIMAACTWLLPLASVLSPASLTSELRTFNDTATCSVATLNFAQESTYDFRDMSKFSLKSLNFYNTTEPVGDEKRNDREEDYFDYYDQPSKNARRLAFSSVYMQKPQPRENASSVFCGSGWNCTYTIGFVAPGYKCDDVDITSGSDVPFSSSSLAPNGSLVYSADVDQGDYAHQDPEADGTSLGVLKSEPVLWIGYAINTSEPYPDDDSHKAKWGNVHKPRILKCVMQYTNYTFDMSFSPRQSATRRERVFLRPVIGEDPVKPQGNVETYKLTASYHSMGSLLRGFLRGKIEQQKILITYSGLSETRLVNSSTSYPLVDLKTEIQDLFEDMLITLLSEPRLVVAQNQEVPCLKSRTMMVYVYYRRSLWIGYAIVIAITFGFMLVGAWSLYENGVASDVLFSRIMATTRNPTLDQLSVGACLGGDPFPKELTKTKLRFGVLLEDDPREGPLGKVEHCCFGTLGETKEIVKGGTYAGLRE
ncbi:hypothetical protein G6011_04597 [Alternaria panax]|uniref:Formylmethionine deformylase-like protein n=1 Tax=Alternaria panax TaxID=48097 RepID=A0AAD4IGU0_9PLEO|nr:hypothetical protein G6011_04597 [Alternaria panax]